MCSQYYCCFGPFRGNVIVGSYLIAIFNCLFCSFLIGAFFFAKFCIGVELNTLEFYFGKELDWQNKTFINEDEGFKQGYLFLKCGVFLLPYAHIPALLANIILLIGLAIRQIRLFTIYLILQTLYLAYLFGLELVATVLIVIYLFQQQYNWPILAAFLSLLLAFVLFTIGLSVWPYSIVCRARRCMKNRRDFDRYSKEQHQQQPQPGEAIFYSKNPWASIYRNDGYEEEAAEGQGERKQPTRTEGHMTHIEEEDDF